MRTLVALSLPLVFSGCAGLAVSLAGAGAGAGVSHQINGNATRTFSEPIDKVDSAVRIASKKMLLQVSEVASAENGSVTSAHVGDLNVSLRVESLSATLTRVSVSARKDIFRVDGATAQEIVTQIDQALLTMNQQASNRGNAVNDARYSDTKSSAQKRKSAI